MKLILVVGIALLTPPAYGQGASYLGLCHRTWDCRGMMKTWTEHGVIVTGWLEGTFADDCKCADKLLNDARAKIVRVHIMNGPCMRNERCGRYEAFWGYSIPKANRDVRRWKGRVVKRFKKAVTKLKQRLKNSKGDLTCYVSPCLECDLNEAARRVLLAYVSVHLPNCILVDNPYGRRCLRGTVCEKHGSNPVIDKPCIVDLDGIDGKYVNMKKWVEQYKHCDIAYYWEPWMNCIKGKFVDPRKRSCKVIHKLFTTVRNLLCRLYFPLLGTC